MGILFFISGLRDWGSGIASPADILRGVSNVPYPRTSADLSRKFLSHCSQISVGEHVQIIAEPIGAKLLFSEKPIISCFRAGHLVGIKFPASLFCRQIFSCMQSYSKSLLHVWPKHQKKSWEITAFSVAVLCFLLAEYVFLERVLPASQASSKKLWKLM